MDDEAEKVVFRHRSGEICTEKINSKTKIWVVNLPSEIDVTDLPTTVSLSNFIHIESEYTLPNLYLPSKATQKLVQMKFSGELMIGIQEQNNDVQSNQSPQVRQKHRKRHRPSTNDEEVPAKKKKRLKTEVEL